MDYSRARWEIFGHSVPNACGLFRDLKAVCPLAWQADWAEQQLAQAGLVCISLGSNKKMGTLSEMQVTGSFSRIVCTHCYPLPALCHISSAEGDCCVKEATEDGDGFCLQVTAQQSIHGNCG